MLICIFTPFLHFSDQPKKSESGPKDPEPNSEPDAPELRNRRKCCIFGRTAIYSAKMDAGMTTIEFFGGYLNANLYFYTIFTFFGPAQKIRIGSERPET